jgi:hypothetical protein
VLLITIPKRLQVSPSEDLLAQCNVCSVNLQQLRFFSGLCMCNGVSACGSGSVESFYLYMLKKEDGERDEKINKKTGRHERESTPDDEARFPGGGRGVLRKSSCERSSKLTSARYGDESGRGTDKRTTVCRRGESRVGEKSHYVTAGFL